MKKEIEKLPEEAYTVLDRLDEKEIARELAGLVEYGAQELIYSFPMDGRQVTGLSWPGAKALARWMATQGHPLDAVEKDIRDDEETWYADVKIVDKETGLGLWGTSKADKTRTLRSGEVKEDRFSRTIALNKAQRNAILAHVPDKMIAEFIKQAIDEGKVRRVSPKEVQNARTRPRREVKPKVASKRTQLKLGRVDTNVIVYNLNALGIGEDGVSVWEQDDGFYVEPSKDLTDEDYNNVNETLGPMGAEWQDGEQRWVIWKEAEDE